MEQANAADAERAETIAAELDAALGAPRQIDPISLRYPGFGLADAYKVAARLNARRGGRRVGRKIGFTNRTIWERYGVDGPMWGDVTDTTLIRLDEAGPVSLAPFLEPRIEPEVALKLAAVPQPGMDEAALRGCVAWFAPAFEIVHSVYPGWSFALADAAASNSLHGALLLGTPVPNEGDWPERLPELRLHLSKDGSVVEVGAGENVLGGPLSALRFLVEGLDAFGEPPLEIGEIITTGTLTDAWPLTPGAVFSAVYEGTPFAPIEARFA
ncbi:hydratase [Acuticoccus sp. M5D2P5]|uniref:2-keto-4-pentenoate hydratase n=1 Tax=Acuticoccus kalidii TaxID=2910977 RepID=UPI001F3616E6|nr:hydratase [Acuticoccus kalidii]MCF3933211.1 hydratase [Acuticoccus kalidii]